MMALVALMLAGALLALVAACEDSFSDLVLGACSLLAIGATIVVFAVLMREPA
jgi:hypothetical protein